MTRTQFNNVPATELHSPDGASALIADHGAHLLSWKLADGQDVLYLSERSKYGAGDAIRGGVPVIFPQFGERGNGKRHGFARVCEWQLQSSGVEGEHAVARYRLDAEHAAAFGWGHDFELYYEIAFNTKELTLTLDVHNRGDAPMTFNAALHTYLRVADIDAVEIFGLQHAGYIDQVQGGVQATQDDAMLTVGGEIDRIYLDVQKPLILSCRQRSLSVRKQGFADVVVWNPWADKAAQLSDMTADDYRAFVCVEAGAIGDAITLQPGETWRGVQSIAPGKARP
jgi:glucose-6-phosphate 1-epimerase